MRNLFKSLGKKGQADIVSTIIAVILAVIMIALGAILANSLFTTFDSEMTGTEMEGAWNTTKDYTILGFDILPISILITVIVSIIAVVMILRPRQ